MTLLKTHNYIYATLNHGIRFFIKSEQKADLCTLTTPSMTHEKKADLCTT